MLRCDILIDMDNTKTDTECRNDFIRALRNALIEAGHTDVLIQVIKLRGNQFITIEPGPSYFGKPAHWKLRSNRNGLASEENDKDLEKSLYELFSKDKA